MIALVCAASVLEASQQAPRPSKQDQKTSGTDQQSTSSPRGSYYDPVVVEIKPTPPTNRDAKKEREEKEEHASERQWVQGVAVVTFVTALLQVWLLWRQKQVMDRQNTIMDGQTALMTDQLQAAKSSAEAAKTSADTARDALYVAESAAIHFAAAKLKYDPDGTRYVVIHWRNFGRTRATHVVLDGLMQTWETATFITEKRTVLERDQEMVIWSNPITIADRLVVDETRRHVRASGTLVYSDIFDRRLLLRFEGTWVPNTEEFEWVYYKTGIINTDGSDKGQQPDESH